MNRSYPKSWFADFLIFLLTGAFIYSGSSFVSEWNSSYNPNYQISLTALHVPMYAAFSALRGFIAYIFSLIFTLFVGYWAAKSPRAERFILPLLDTMQSIPVLGFLPGLVLGLVSLFPRSNLGLELASILMIFTGQVWNMTFAFYASLKSIPTELNEASSILKLTHWQKLKFLELPFSAMSLTWNSVMSMAGGWFFLSVCEAFTLGQQNYRLPGLGAYMAVAIEQGDYFAMAYGGIAMILIIIFFDLILWRPALAWAHRFRMEESDKTISSQDPMLNWILNKSWIIKKIQKSFQASKKKIKSVPHKKSWQHSSISSFRQKIQNLNNQLLITHWRLWKWLGRTSIIIGLLLIFSWILPSTKNLFISVSHLGIQTWKQIFLESFWTLLRVIGSLVLGTLWTTPLAIWISLKPSRMQWAQPLIQTMASFPAPMLYPMALGAFIYLKIPFELGAMLLMLLGVQWYILFNVLAGATRIPAQLSQSMELIGSSRWTVWRYLLLPSVLPSLATGWITAAGGAWNASIVAEIILYHGTTYKAHGLGALINQAAERADFENLAACLIVMVVVVIILNRTVWAKVYQITQTRFRLDL